MCKDGGTDGGNEVKRDGKDRKERRQPYTPRRDIT